MPTLITEKTVTARKTHCCLCCGVVAIQPGDTYQRTVLAYDGRVYTWVSCAGCDSITDDVWDWCGRPDEGVGIDSYHEWAVEHRDDPRAVAYLDRLAGDE